MIKPIEKNKLFLRMRAQEATPADLACAQDLADTLAAHAGECVGMAANMIGVPKRIIAFYEGEEIRVMFNPEIVARAGEYEAQEGCLSLEGTRQAARFEHITVRYQDAAFDTFEEGFAGWIAQIIQHEVDHTNGIVI